MARRLNDGVWLLNLGLLPPLASNAFLLEDDDGELTMIDCGLPWNLNSIASEFSDTGHEAADLDRLLITHYDLDHVGGFSGLLPEFDGPVYISTVDAAIIRGDRDPPLFHHKGAFHRIARHFFGLPDALDVRLLDDGDGVDGFTAYHTPGHNPGHMVYVHDSGVAFLGDLVWEDDGRLTPPFWLDSYDMSSVRESIQDLASDVPPFEVAAMAHGDPLTEDGRRALLDLAARL
jgi:glyoxylase-like metal-dependent hydrolase (beta-lactamase superfamily II)